MSVSKVAFASINSNLEIRLSHKLRSGVGHLALSLFEVLHHQSSRLLRRCVLSAGPLSTRVLMATAQAKQQICSLTTESSLSS